MRRFALAATVAMVAAGAAAPTAAGSGGPPIYTSAQGIGTPSGRSVLDAIHVRRRTILVRVLRRTGRIADYSTIRGAFWVSGVGSRAIPTGLSADGRTLVLQGPSFNGRSSSFAIVEAKNLRLRGVVRLPGAFGLDGVSPDGRRMYLVEYPSPLRNPTRYAIRAYDLQARHLAAKPIVDPSDEEQMRGVAITRATSPGGHWAYTLYTGAASGMPPFIHALDLAHGRAKCIDLPRAIGNVGSDDLRISHDGRTLALVSRRQGALASVDTRTFEVSTRAAAGTATTGSGSDFPWVLLALGAGLAIATASLWWMPRLHRRRLAGTDD
jgi:hypothetical protein